ncbi:MAG: MobF family relaxase, partial [Streptosporangiaceae bacterium]
MSVKASIAKGVDVSYHWRQAQVGGEARRPGAGYYIEAAGGAREAGEPPGRWWGTAAEHLGLAPGQEVEAAPYFALFGEHVDPRDGVTQLGRAPGKAAGAAAARYEEMLAAEPHVTAERRRELRILAVQEARTGPAYFDLTLSFSKSVSVFHASMGEAARAAREAGDAAAERFWSGEVEAMDEMLYGAARAGFGYFQREAGYTRTGHHGGGRSGEDAGRWEAADLAAVHWLQHTSRDDDMQLHIHTQIAHVSRTVSDGKWRAPDSAGYGRAVGASGAITAAHLEEAMSLRFGVEWETRADGLGREIRGISQGVMDLFSQRRASISAETARLAREFEEANGRKPSQRVLAAIAQHATLTTRRAKGTAARDAGSRDAAARDAAARDAAARDAGSRDAAKLDLDALGLSWAQRLREATGAELASIAPAVSRPADADADSGGTDGPDTADLRRAKSRAVALAVAERPTWTRGDLIRHLGRAMPVGADLEAAADEILSGPGVVCVTGFEVEEAPPELRDASGRSLYARPGRDRFTTPEQLAGEDRLVDLASQRGAPSLSREHAAASLGADAAALDAALHARAQDAGAEVTQSGLRVDQAAAVFWALTSDQRASVITGPAGSGKTRSIAETARLWPGPVIGIAPSQASRNVLADAGVAESWNFAQFLGHTDERRGAAGPKAFGPDTLLVVDEASMLSQPDLADIMALAAARSAKVVVVGDQAQLQAVEAGGGMGLLAERLGYAQLATPVRFRADWEREASLRLRAGDASVVAEYDQHGRLAGGSAELVLDEAARRYVAHFAAGRDVLLMARGHEDCRELARRVRDDLVHLGYVDPGRSAGLRAGARASSGDLIIARHGDNKLIAGDTGRTLANGDTMQVESVNDDGSLTVRRLIDADQDTGERRYSAQFTYRALDTTDLAYAVTGHSAQGRSVGRSLAFLRGAESRQWTYVAMSRGAVEN